MSERHASIVWAVDARGRVLGDAPVWRALSGQSVEAWRREGWWTALHPDDAHAVREEVAAALEAGRAWQRECRLVGGKGEVHWVVAGLTPFADDRGVIDHFITSVTDITERKLLDAEHALLLEHAESARVEAVAANRSKDEFLATLSHELRTPLNAMLGWAQLLRGDRLDEDSRRHALETIERNAKVQAQLVEDVLDVSRIVAGKLRLHFHAVDLRQVAEAAVDAVRPAAEVKQIDLSVRLDASPVPVSGDGDRLEQVAWNLLANAIKFTPRGGRVELEVRRDLRAIMRVRDSGRGISRDFLPHVFDRFRQADPGITRAHGGLGLGLAIVRHLVELHGGEVSAESAGEGRGATFTVLVPVRSQPGDPDQFIDDPTMTDDLPTLARVRVLLVEDDADARDLLSLVLRQYGAEVVVAETVVEALAVLERFRPHVLVSDIGLPGQNGYDLIRRVREAGLVMPAVALTAYASDEDGQRALEAGFQMHVAKPVEPDVFVSTVARVSGWGDGRM